MKALKMVLGVCLFTLGALFQLGLWSSVLQVLGGILFFTSLMGKSDDKQKTNETTDYTDKKTIKSKETKASYKVKIKGRIALVTFFFVLFLGGFYKFEVNQSQYLWEVLGVFTLVCVTCLNYLREYLELIFKGESF